MEENKNHSKMRLSEQLPTHSANPGTWNRLADKLDAFDAEAVYQQRLQQLPVHSPDNGMWAVINSRLSRAAYLRNGIRIALSAAAGLLLIFTVSRISDSITNSTSVPGFAGQKPSNTQQSPANQANTAVAQKLGDQIKKQNSKPRLGSNAIIDFSSGSSKSDLAKYSKIHNLSPTKPTAGNVLAATALLQPDVTENFTEFSAAVENAIEKDIAIPMPDEKTLASEYHNTTIRKSSFPIQDFLHTPIDSKITESSKEYTAANQPKPSKSFDPDDAKANSKNNNFALAMGYLPENIYNGTNNSMFHNLDLTASYNKEKVRFNTSLGMAYNEAQVEVNMNYAVKSPVTAMMANGLIDTLGYSSANMQSDYIGTEKHQYFTYNLGIGKRLFSLGKFSTWINAGAGFGILLNNPDLIAATENSIKSQYNAKITNLSTNTPVYNDVNVNFVTAIDFNYRLLNKLSLSFTPTSRWYFKPVLSKNNQATDEMTLGFKSGIRFDF